MSLHPKLTDPNRSKRCSPAIRALRPELDHGATADHNYRVIPCPPTVAVEEWAIRTLGCHRHRDRRKPPITNRIHMPPVRRQAGARPSRTVTVTVEVEGIRRTDKVATWAWAWVQASTACQIGLGPTTPDRIWAITDRRHSSSSRTDHRRPTTAATRRAINPRLPRSYWAGEEPVERPLLRQRASDWEATDKHIPVLVPVDPQPGL